MSWYSVHAITGYRFKSEPQYTLEDIEEGVFLIEGNSFEEAVEKATKLIDETNQCLNSGQGMLLNDKPIDYYFEGIRHIVDLGNELPSSGDVITIWSFEIANESALKDLLNEDADVRLRCIDFNKQATRQWSLLRSSKPSLNLAADKISTWHGIHTIFSSEPKADQSGSILVYEVIVLLLCADAREAYLQINELADSICQLFNESSEFSGTVRYAGIRKCIKISNPSDSHLDQWHDPPTDRTEITYSEFELSNNDDLKKFIKGEAVELIYLA